MGETGRETDTEREIWSVKQTDRERDRQGETGRGRKRQTNREIERSTVQAGRERNRDTGR